MLFCAVGVELGRIRFIVSVLGFRRRHVGAHDLLFELVAYFFRRFDSVIRSVFDAVDNRPFATLHRLSRCRSIGAPFYVFAEHR